MILFQKRNITARFLKIFRLAHAGIFKLECNFGNSQSFRNGNAYEFLLTGRKSPVNLKYAHTARYFIDAAF